MKKIMISDVTLKEAAKKADMQLSFKEKIEVAKLMDKIRMSVIEMAPIVNEKIDSLLIKSVSSSVKNSVVAVPAGLSAESVAQAWEAVKGAKKPRLQVIAPMSPVQMEYGCHKKPAQLLELIGEVVAECKKVCPDVEFVADDATRSEKEFLFEVVKRAIAAGASTVTVCDSAGVMLPDEFSDFLSELAEAAPEVKTVSLGACCSNSMSMAAACAMAAIKAGAVEIKTSCGEETLPTAVSVAQIIRLRGDFLGICADIAVTEMQRTMKQINWIIHTRRGKSPFDGGTGALDSGMAGMQLTVHDGPDAVASAVRTLGYDLSDDDMNKVYESFKLVAASKNVDFRELDAIIASVALQVPPTYYLESYVINTGNIITSTATITLTRNGQKSQGISAGDGPVDASFLAIEQIVGHHYELDDFQIQSVTEGKEAMGSAVVKLRHNGKLYAGKGISTNIVGASIRAYLNALNKIVYEEN